MAVRLPLVLSQPSRRDATATEVIENIVAASLLLPKLDANLIGDIDSIEVGGTDHLCLQGHTRDLILVAFLDIHAAQAAWQRLGQTGQFIDCKQSTDMIRHSASATSQRRVFYFQLAHDSNLVRLLDQFQELVAAQAVQLVSIKLGTSQSTTLASLPVLANPKPQSTSPGSPKPQGASPGSSKPQGASPGFRTITEDDEDWSRIDQLVDDLDAMDI